MWCSLGPDAEEQPRAYAYNYMRRRNEDVARSLSAAMTCFTPEGVRKGIENVEAAGADEVILIPITAHDEELDRVISLLT